jgi:hypothetical protein
MPPSPFAGAVVSYRLSFIRMMMGSIPKARRSGLRMREMRIRHGVGIGCHWLHDFPRTDAAMTAGAANASCVHGCQVKIGALKKRISLQDHTGPYRL